ncbi:MAG: hypothetical protein LBQ81_06490 [Zoogloeaceae bacterium]|nr:hypothetical protein [Zoogloeaceae bacterium]
MGKKTGFQLAAAIEHSPRINAGLRIGLALFGSYGLALLAAAAFAAGLPFDFKPDAVSLAVMLAFLLHLVSVIWVFATATVLRAALGLAIPAAIFALWLYAVA